MCLRHEELARAVKEEDAMPASAKEARVKQFRKLKQQIRELQMRHRSLEIELYRREWSHRACLREKDALIRKYKQQLFLAAEREWILEERNKMQAERDWQQLCENAESDWYQKSENMTRSPSSAREQVGADRQKTDHRLHEVKTLRSALPVEREQTTQASFNRCILPEGDKQCDYKSFLNKDIPALEIRKLREQNANLRAAVAQMRKEMESLDEQTSSVPPAATGERAERGSLCTNDISAGASIKVSSTNLDCIVSPDTEKGPNPKVLGENVAKLNQQSPDADPGVGPQYGVSCTLRGMHNTLKEAARKISILSQEKQQLIEMGNRLRAELGMLLKEGLWHPVSSEHCAICTASGSLFPRELVKRTQCQLSALKHLQHRLTTQELQYAKRLCPLRIPSLIARPGLKGEPAPSSRGREAASPSAEVQLDFSIENHWPEQQKADTSSTIIPSQPLRPSPRPAQQVQLSSPRAHNFCQGIWQTLETGSSLPAFSPQKNTAQVECEVLCSTEQSEESQQNIKAKDELEVPGSDLAVRGTRLEVQQKLKSRNSSCPHPIKPKIPSNITKIRNYNIKD
ncbi:coiled-coil domain-containing protein 57 isoform B [Patagioenas fasciata monilis]|uniref:Coiled-coil domain-containing protein 57 isoform B n=1 Tax=Patagioenas fasciata monilis TaxID=372326 RepID=A0A1V4K582_PATFA|nr:coiled-coil domain-containing protein 57 isoform B [Patagioenas fasciata monilis]